MLLIWSLIAAKCTCFLGLPTDPPKGDDKWKSANREDDTPHANTPAPACGSQDRRCDITANPRVDDERSCRHVREEETGPKRSSIRDDDFDEQNNAGISDLVENGTSSKP